MKGEGRMSMGLAAFGTVVAAVVMYWWLSTAVLSSLEAVGVIDGRNFVPVPSDSGHVSISLPLVIDNGSDGPLREYEKPEIRLEPDLEYFDEGPLDYPDRFGQGFEIANEPMFDLSKLNAESVFSIKEMSPIPFQEEWKWRDSILPRYMKRYDIQPLDPRLFESPEFPDFQIPKWIPEPIPPMELPHLSPGDHKWSDQYQSINPIMPKMPAVQDFKSAFARQIGQ